MFEKWNWQPPEGWTVIETLDAHAAGEPLRIITALLPPVRSELRVEGSCS